ncbi:hypothetical protein F0U60_36820 [Archangium minus]|uniref:Extensin-like protein n=1 Tax=Archangium minus TaxID=83450 RepID=A0ABY9X0Y8_9BACT|nr:hypothetical protein F0U60_36820 [Archangium minus]
MAGILSSFVLTGLLAAGPVGFTFDGPEATARTVGNVGFFTQGPSPFTDLFERGTGSAELSVQDRISDVRALYGDAGSLVATFDIAGDTYRVELEQVGFPPAQALSATGPLPPPPAQAISGGVVLNQDMHGGAPLGAANMSRVRAAVALWGVGRVWRNGQLLTDTAVIHAAALERGAHADDDTFRTLPVARPGDTELDVLVWNLPREAEPRGFIQFDFEDVAITVDGVDVPAVAVVPTAGAFVGVAPPSSPVPGGASLGSVPNTTPQQQQGVGGSGLAGVDSGQFGAGQGQFGAGQGQFGAGQGQFGAGQGQFGAGQGQFGTGAVAGTQPGGFPVLTGTQQVDPNDTTLPVVANAAGQSVLQPFQNPGRVTLSAGTPAQPEVGTPGFPGTPIVPEAFLTPDSPGRVALNANEPGPPGQPEARLPALSATPIVPDAFQNPDRVRIASQLPPASVGGFVPLSPAPQSTFLSTSGSFSVVPLVPGVPGPEFAFGGARVSPGVVSTPATGQVQSPAVPLVATPQPLTSQTAVPFVANPLPLNGLPAVPLISTPAPLNAQPINTLPGATTAAPAATTAAPAAALGGGAAPSP